MEKEQIRSLIENKEAAYEAAHRAGWEQARREAAETAATTPVPYSIYEQGAAGYFIADAIAAMEYKRENT